MDGADGEKYRTIYKYTNQSSSTSLSSFSTSDSGMAKSQTTSVVKQIIQRLDEDVQDKKTMPKIVRSKRQSGKSQVSVMPNNESSRHSIATRNSSFKFPTPPSLTPPTKKVSPKSQQTALKNRKRFINFKSVSITFVTLDNAN